jgi:hypothetical protein
MKVKKLFQEQIIFPYLGKVQDIGNIKVYIVDGNYIRTHLEKDFTNFGQHYRWPELIPINEFWIDKEANEDELGFFIMHLLTEYELMKSGKEYDYALKEADQVERRERRREEGIRKFKSNIASTTCHKNLYKTSSTGVEIWIVDGKKVRNHFYTDFTEGGHEFIYKWIPKNEVWIDDDLEPQEINFVLLHEFHERNLMEKGMPYSDAHASALDIEYKSRNIPVFLPGYLKEEGL